MEHYGVPGLTVAVIEDFEIDWVATYGLADRETGVPVRPSTLFQAASISKSVAAFAAMLMVAQGRLDLDRDINADLVSWKLPDSEFTEGRPVTLSHLLSHTGGLNIHGFPGYAVGAGVPTLVQVLDGSWPANTGPVRVTRPLGQQWSYSGGGYSVIQQMMVDVSGRTFPRLLDDLVLHPAGMTQSTFENPLPAAMLADAAAGYTVSGTAVPGKRHTYPEMAAAGLWTTAADLARFVIAVQKSIAGESDLMPPEVAARMLTPGLNDYAYGFGITHRGDDDYFGHDGWNEGFCSRMLGGASSGNGVVVLINSNHYDFMAEVVNAVAHEYRWEGFEALVRQPTPEDLLVSAPGRYRYNAELSISVTRHGDHLVLQYSGGLPTDLNYVGEGRFLRSGNSAAITFADDGGERASALSFVLSNGDLQSHARLLDIERMPRELLIEADFPTALAAYRRLLSLPVGERVATEAYLNNRGLGLLERDFDQGIALLRLATELYSSSANTWDSLGLAYRQAGQIEKAKLNYRKALARDPEFPSALQALADMN